MYERVLLVLDANWQQLCYKGFIFITVYIILQHAQKKPKLSILPQDQLYFLQKGILFIL